MVGVVVHGDFGLRNRGSKFGVVHQNFAAFVDFAGIVELLECPPDRLHKIFVHGAIAIVKIYPATNTIDGRAPSFGVGDHGFTGFDDVIFESPFGADVAAVGNAKLFFDEILGRKAVTIPAPSTLDTVAIHGPIARYSVFYDRAKKRAMMRITGNKWWAVVENVGLVFGP